MWRSPGNILLQDASDCFGFDRIDSKHALLARCDVAVGLAASIAAYHAGHAPVNHDFQIFEVLAVEDRLDPVGQPRDNSTDRIVLMPTKVRRLRIAARSSSSRLMWLIVSAITMSKRCLRGSCE